MATSSGFDKPDIEKVGRPAIPGSPWVGAAWKITAFFCYAALNTLARFLSGGVESGLDPLPVNVIVFFQDFFALIIMLPWLIKQWGTKIQFPKLHTVRVLLSAAAVIFWTFALFYLPQADAVALSIIGPVMGVIGAKWLLHEKVSGARLWAIVFAFIGAAILIKPLSAFAEHTTNVFGLGCVVVSALCFALAKIATRKLASLGVSRQLLTATLLVLIVPVTLIPALFVWVTPSVEHLLWLGLGGVLTAAALYSVSSALAFAEVSFLAPFDFIQFILNASIAYFAFTELPASWAVWLVMGAMLIGVPLARLRARF